ncbi:restriction endonuclease subunit S [Runella slithyformis]|uniref:Restriction modification system DNA specificity domain protein n=1 Tax=Runella slithyformis (strain ATCC 29530 / DSM 19594 / LMG 11500 / NCIMB 11436 / LSU 4) TaxID=761193 RepID=A0A7U3ZM12_RUNSL|nr:restriction endonuclease subunit S [Runella slithyformis]AEI49711.1 restriction modification system DNA specificity domain protein [Runella slithyformis DSM 19594]
MENELPEGWELTKLSQVFDVRDGTHDSPKYVDIGFQLVTSKNLKNGQIDLTNVNYISENDFVEINKRSKVDKGDLLFSMIGTIGSLAVITEEPMFAIKNVALFKPICEVSTFFLAYYLNNPLVKDKMLKEAKGSTQKFVGLGYLRDLSIPLPPLAEQKRIVAKLDAAFGHLETLKTSLNRIPELLKKFRQNVLTQAVTGKLTEGWREENVISDNTFDTLPASSMRDTKLTLPTNWKWLPFNSVAEVKSNLVEPLNYLEYPLIAPDNIEAESGKLINKPLVSDIMPKSPKHSFESGDIIYSKIRPYLSKLIIANFNGLCSADMYPIQTVLKTEYLYYYMLSKLFLSYANTAGERSVLPKINQNGLGIIPIPVPPLEEQKEIVKRVEALFAQADALEAQYESLKAKIEKLPQALLAKAFRGELVPQDPTDEPAAVLLQKIKAEAAKGGKKKEKNGQIELAF